MKKKTQISLLITSVPIAFSLVLSTGCSKQESTQAFCGQPFKFRSKTVYSKNSAGKKNLKWRHSFCMDTRGATAITVLSAPAGGIGAASFAKCWTEHEWQPMYKLNSGVDLGQATELYLSLDFGGGSGANSNETNLSDSSSDGDFGGSTGSTNQKEGLDAAEAVFQNFKSVMANSSRELKIFEPAKTNKSKDGGNQKPSDAGHISICAAACVNPMLVAIQGAKLIGDKLKAVMANMNILRAKRGTEEEAEAKAQFALLNEEKVRYEWKLIQIQSAMREAYTSCQRKSFETATNVKGRGSRQRSGLIAENFKAAAMETCTCDVGIDWEAMTGDDNPFDADDKVAAELEGQIDPPGWNN